MLWLENRCMKPGSVMHLIIKENSLIKRQIIFVMTCAMLCTAQPKSETASKREHVY